MERKSISEKGPFLKISTLILLSLLLGVSSLLSSPAKVEGSKPLQLLSPENKALISGNTTTLRWDLVTDNWIGENDSNYLVFDGSDDYVDLPDSNSLDLDNWTVSCWVKVDDKSSKNTFVSKRAPGGSDINYALGNWANGKIYVAHTIGGNWKTLDYSGDWSEDKWYWVAGVNDGENTYLYLNGNEVVTGGGFGGNSDQGGAQDEMIGSFPDQNRMDGSISDVRIYGRVLSVGEIENLYRGYFVENSDLAGWWKLDDGSGQTVSDSSGKGNYGTLGGDNFSGETDPDWVSGGPLLFRVWIDGSHVGEVSSNQYETDPLSTGSHSWRVEALGTSGDFTRYSDEFFFSVENRVQIDITPNPENWRVSDYLTGSHFVYAFERDSLYENEDIAEWMRRSKLGVIRWPGGTVVQNYHWDNLDGNPWVDHWDPGYTENSKPPEDYMDLDEYISYCRRVDVEPMVGINIKSGKEYGRESEAREEARRLVNYCENQGYDVDYWYIGNECYKGWTPHSYADYIDNYASILKSVDNDIKIVGDWKFSPEEKNRLAQTITICKESDHIDIMDIHEKWGNSWGLDSTPETQDPSGSEGAAGTISDWKNQFPIYSGRLGEYIDKFHDEMREAGKNVKIAFNEWGVRFEIIENASSHDAALIVADFMIELFRNKVEMACYWNLNMGGEQTKILLTDETKHHLEGFNPTSEVFEMFAPALGSEMLQFESTFKDVYGLAVRDNELGPVQVYIMNKSPEIRAVSLNIENLEWDGKNEILGPHESLNAFGEYSYRSLKKENLNLELSPYSFNRLVLDKESEITRENLAPVFGDVNMDNTVNIVDALQVARYDAGLNPSPFEKATADVNGDSAIDILDALQIARYDAGLISGF